MPKLSIIILSYNSPDILKETLNSFFEKIQKPSFEIIVVDNASKDNNIRMIEKYFPQVKLIKSTDNLGFAKGCNLGVDNAKGEFLLFANSDIILKENPVPEVIDVFNNYYEAGIVGCQLLNQDGSIQPSYYRFPKLRMRFLQLSGLKDIIIKLFPKVREKKSKVFKVDFVSGAFLTIKKDFFEKIGKFDEDYFMYIEDADLAYRCKLKGKEVFIMNTDKIIHLNENHENIENSFVFQNLNKGHILFYKRHYNKITYYSFLLISILLFTIRYFLYFFIDSKKERRSELKKIIKLYMSSFIK